MTLHFPTWDALHFVLTNKVLPDAIVRQPGRLSVDPKSGIVFAPQQLIALENVETLTSIGIVVNGPLAGPHQYSVNHLWQAIPLERKSSTVTISANTPVLFVVSETGALERFINELLRLGNDRISIRSVDSEFLVLVYGPPYYSLLPSLDASNSGAPRAFIEMSPRFWVELGWSYPLHERVLVDESQLVLVSPPHLWKPIAAGSFRDIADTLAIAAPTQSDISPDHLREAWKVDLGLTPASSTEPGSLWVILDRTLEQLDTLVQSMDPTLLDRFTFALSGPLGIIRLRPSRAGRPDIDIPGLPYRSYLRIPNLFVPTTQRLQPPLHRETMRRLLAADPNLIYVTLESNGQLQVESFAESAFRPLSSFIDDVLQRDRDSLQEWMKGTQFAFAELTHEELPSVSTPAEKVTVANPPPKNAEEVRAASSAPLVRQRTRSLTPQSAPLPIPKTDADRRQQLSKIEADFVAAGGTLNSPQRRGLWPQLARLNADLGQPAEAALAWNHALWDGETLADEQLWGWVRSEQALSKTELTETAMATMLARSTPTPSEVRAFASVLTWGGNQTPIPPALRQTMPQVATYLQVHEHLLPIRSVWLAWLAWCRAAGGDALTLARARDRLLTRLLERGLNPEVDLPSFLRFAGREDGDRLRAVRGWIEEIRVKVRQWYVQQTKADVRTDPTAAYIDLLFAMGFARLGETSASRSLMKQAELVLTNITGDTADAHDFLLQAFVWRIEEVLAGRSGGGPFPPEMLDYLTQLHLKRGDLPRSQPYEIQRLVPFAIDRFRQQLRMIDPQERFDPDRQFRLERNELIQSAALLPDVRGTSELQRRVYELVQQASKTPDVLLRVLAKAVVVTGRLGTDVGSKLLDRVLPAINAVPRTNDIPILRSQLELIERSLFFAAHFDRADLIQGLINQLLKLMESDSSKDLLLDSNYAIGETLLSLRKLGLRDETLTILDRLAASVLRNRTLEELTAGPTSSWIKHLIPLLHVATGWNCLDHASRAEPILAAAKRLLYVKNRPGNETVEASPYVHVLCNAIAAFSFLPASEARAQIGMLFDDNQIDVLPNGHTTRMFYSRFHLNVAEAVVLAFASQEFALGSAARHWLDEDEYLIRQRIHRDVRAAVGPR